MEYVELGSQNLKPVSKSEIWISKPLELILKNEYNFHSFMKQLKAMIVMRSYFV